MYYQDDAEPLKVGGLVLARDGVIHFQYDATWLSTGIELSPWELPLDVGLQVVPAPDRRKLHGLHGVFADALPDDWGMRVLSMALRRHGIDPERAGPLDRLAYLGSRTMGALTFRAASAWPREAARAASLDQLAAHAAAIYEGTVRASAPQEAPDTHEETASLLADTINTLERAAGSAGGAQPKVLLATSPDGMRVVAGGEPPPGYIPRLLKFTPRRDGLGLRTDSGPVEEACARMARAAGINVPPTRLFSTTDGRLHFTVERFDRTPWGGRRHVHTFGGLLGREASDDADYEDLLRRARALTGSATARDDVLRRLCFNLLVLNDDDHLKNTAFLFDPVDGWRLSPAYDLTYAPSRHGERGMAIAGLQGKATWATVRALAERHSLKRGRFMEILAQVEDAVADWPRYAREAHVPPASISELQRAFDARRAHLMDESSTG